MDEINSRIEKAHEQIKNLTAKIRGIREVREEVEWSEVGLKSQRFGFAIRRTLRAFGKVLDASWSGDGYTIASVSQDSSLVIWNAFSEQKRNAFKLSSSWMTTCEFDKMSTNNDIVAIGGLDNKVSVYNVSKSTPYEDGKPAQELTEHDGHISDICFIDREKLVSSSGDKTIIQWDIKNARPVLKLEGHTNEVLAVAANPFDRRILVSGSADNSTRIWDTRMDRSCIFNFDSNFTDDVNCVSFFPSGYAFAAGSSDSTCRLFDLRSSCQVNCYSEEKIVSPVHSISFSRSGRLLFAAYEDPLIVGWETVSNDGSFHEMHGQNARSKLDVSLTGEALLSASWDHTIAVWA